MKTHEQYVDPISNLYNHVTSESIKAGLLYLQSVGDYTYQAGYCLNRSMFESFLVGVVLSGSMFFECDGKTYHAQPGNIILLDCYKAHCYYAKNECRLLWCHFNGMPASVYFDKILRSHDFVFETVHFKRIQYELDGIYKMFHEMKSVDDFQIALMLTTILTYMVDLPMCTDKMQNTHELIDRVVCYINEHLDEDISTEKLAKIAGFSNYHFIRLFDSVIGVTPKQYVISARMHYARFLLKTTLMSVQEIGFLVGYKSESLLCSMFRKNTGITPVQYRNQE